MTKSNQFENALGMDISICDPIVQNYRKSVYIILVLYFKFFWSQDILVKRFFKRELEKMTIPFEHRLVMTCRLASLFLLVRETAAVCMTCNYLFVISLFLQFDRMCIYLYVL